MSYDPDLAERIRALTAAEPDVTERAMFGGLGFLIGGHLALSASGRGGLLARVEPADTAALIGRSGVTIAVMRGREMPGWLRVPDAAIVSDEALATWVRRSVRFVRSLPPK